MEKAHLRALSSRVGDLKDLVFLAMRLLTNFNDGNPESQPIATYRALYDLAAALEAELAHGNGGVVPLNGEDHKQLWLQIRRVMGGYAERGFFTMGDSEATWVALADFDETLD